jgi:heme exporter protein D
MSLADFIGMGGYAAFVWPSYAVALVVLVGNVIAARASHRRALAEARRRTQGASQ